MQEDQPEVITEEELFTEEEITEPAESAEPSPKKPTKKQPNKRKIFIIIAIVTLVLIAAGVAVYFFVLRPLWNNQPPTEDQPATKPEPEIIRYYSKLSGEEIPDDKLNNLPTFCVQIPNGTDGARPQVGLAAAPIVFEAIAEGGITRFAAIFQGYNSAMLGPIRSLRPYYLEWDTPLDCTIVHAGGSTEALQMVKAGGYRDLTESTTYMWRSQAYRAPNNLFTSTDLLNKFNLDRDFISSQPAAFTRFTPDEAEQNRLAIAEATKPKPGTDENGNEIEQPGTPLVTNISLKFGFNMRNFDLKYVYDEPTNSYKRFYDSDAPHTAYLCPYEGISAKPNPSRECGEVRQLNPNVVIALMVEQSTAANGKHQNITTIGTGDAYIFQNGTAIKATWEKPDKSAQLKFTDENGEEVPLVPGQAWVTALPRSRGKVIY